MKQVPSSRELADFSEHVLVSNDLDQLFREMLSLIQSTVSPTNACLMIYDLSENKIVHEQSLLPESLPLDYKITRSNDLMPLIDNGWQVLGPGDNDNEFYLLHHSNHAGCQPVELFLPFIVQCELVGVLSLSHKESGTDYRLDEMNLLRILINMIALATPRFFKSVGSKPEESNKPRTGVITTRLPIARQDDYKEILGGSDEIRHIIDIIDRVAGENVPVLLTGESGTGKELIARAIHRKSRESEKPLVAMNCAALPDALVESELFGHEKGAFTGAMGLKKGKFEFAEQSTLFLDEIGDMSLGTQAKLLRVLQDGTFQRIGGNETLHSKIRLIAATNQDLKRRIQEGRFREDLFYRINVVQITMPPLKNHREDIPLLADHFFHHYNRFFNKNLKGIDQNLMDWLMSYSFPGNVRELKNIIERAVILETGDFITMHSMPSFTKEQPTAPSTPRQKTLEAIEKEHIESVLRETGFNKSAASRRLGIARKTLREKIAKYGIPPLSDA